MTCDKSPRKFLIATWEGGGSVGPKLTVARKLMDAGHDVRVMSDECNRLESEAIGARFIPWTRAPSRADRNRESDPILDWAQANPLEGFAQALDAVFTGRALDYALDTIDELRREPADLVVSSELLFGVMAACETLDQPMALMPCNSLMFPLTDAPPAGPVRFADMTPDQQAQAGAMFAAASAVFDGALPQLNEARALLALPPLASLMDQLKPARKVLIGISRFFDFAPQGDHGRYSYVGPQLDDLAWTGEWQSPWPSDDARPLALVGFSTTFQNHVAIMQRVIDALATLPVRALVTLGPAIDPEELTPAANTLLVRSAPHNAVLKEANLVVTHGGHGTLARAMAHKLPVLVIPHGRDQDGNAARIVAH
ncbi:MAG: hypothetical protein B7Y91_01430, partial [Rhodobacterales bacterium 32-64-14]